MAVGGRSQGSTLLSSSRWATDIWCIRDAGPRGRRGALPACALCRASRAIALVACSFFSSTIAAEVVSPLSPQQSLEHLVVEPGSAVELVACEPQVVDPVAIRFDEDGRLWVVEMRDYPNGPPPGSPALSCIAVLDDRDGDGRYETRTLFAEHLLFPTGLQPWRGGVFVTLSGQVTYLKDTDGDGRADLSEVWYRGFTEENPQLRANHPRLGLDNRVHVANGLRGGAVVDARVPVARPLSISGMDFCFDPLTGRAAAVSGNGQFGLAFDDFGSRFVCNNRAPVEHVVLENEYLARNPFLAVGSVVSSVAAAGEQSRVFPLTRAWTTSNLHAGQFTAACGVEIYRGDALGDQYRGNAFVCEPTGSLVHREVAEPHGVTFSSKPAREGQEFLASPDAWFRPVNLEVGPDGALYVVDMYRAVIEHPQFMPSELQHRPDLRLGDDRGRIYRIVPAGRPLEQSKPRLSKSPSAALVELLGHENGWWRETAARLLLERQDASARPQLETLAARATEPVARVQAMGVLAGLGALSSSFLQQQLRDEHPRVREQAVRLAESRLNDDASLRKAVILLAADRDDRVRFCTALALGGLAREEVTRPLAAISLARPDDVWTRRAVEAALPMHSRTVLAEVLASPLARDARFDAAVMLLIRELSAVVGAQRDEAKIDELLNALAPSLECAATTDAVVLGVCQGLAGRGQTLAKLFAERPDTRGRRQALLDRAFDRAIATAADTARAEAERVAAIELLRFAGRTRAASALVHMVANDGSKLVRVRAAAALESYGDDEVGAKLLDGFEAQTPAVRQAILDALVAQPASARQLLDAIRSGAVARIELGAGRENALRRSADSDIRGRANELLAATVPAERNRVLAEYQASLTIEGTPPAGKPLFARHCAACHRIGDVGVNVAPDISDSRVKTPAQLLVDILNPNQAIDNNYASYVVVMVTGAVHTGIIGGETANSIRLRQPEDKSLDLLRSEIESIRSTGVSLMPEGLEKQITVGEMADLIAFIKNWRYLEEPIPATIAPDAK
jgi:putative membrane-bound dehydrogenase-like protein